MNVPDGYRLWLVARLQAALTEAKRRQRRLDRIDRLFYADAELAHAAHTRAMRAAIARWEQARREAGA